MSPEEVASLLKYAATLDRWLRETDREAAQMMVMGWTSLLGPVPLAEAQQVVHDHYAQPQARTITPGDVLEGYRAMSRARVAEQDAVEAEQAALVGPASVLVSGNAGAAYLRSLHAAHVAGQPLDQVPRPEGLGVLSHNANVRARRCRWHELCACDHLECRDGWSDDVIVTHDAQGRRHDAVRRCSHCEDAVKMAEERGLLKKPKPGWVRR